MRGFPTNHLSSFDCPKQGSSSTIARERQTETNRQQCSQCGFHGGHPTPAPWPVKAEVGVQAINGGVIAATTLIDGMTDVLQVMLLLATLIWTVVKIAQAIKDLKGD